jgi:hypothetical protein
MADCKEPMADLIVALTTTEFVSITEGGDTPTEIDLFTYNIPVCVAEMVMDFPPILPNGYLFRIHSALTSNIDCIDINSNLGTVFIGKDKNEETTGLIVYQDIKNTPPTRAFFKRWDETETLMMQYTIFNRFNKVVCCVRGYWAKGSWIKLSVIPEPTIHIRDINEL